MLTSAHNRNKEILPMIETAKYSLRVGQMRVQQIQDDMSDDESPFWKRYLLFT